LTANREEARWVRAVRAALAVAEGHGDEAATEARAFGTRYFCQACTAAMLALAHDAAGRSDSALAQWEAYATSRQRLVWWDYQFLAHAYQRMGELYEAGGNRDQAVEWYGRFVDLWAGADPVLQPVVRDVRTRIQRLTGEAR